MDSLSNTSRELAGLVARVEKSVVGVSGRCGPSVSGVAWAADLVVTSARALEHEEGVAVNVAGRRVKAERVGVHGPSDVALLRVEAELSPLPRAAEAELAAGQLVLALGRPGEGVRAKLGMLSVLGGAYRLPGGVEVSRYVESDVAPSGGLSGGALVNTAGELIGINTVRLTRGALVTLPTSSVERVVTALASHGRLRRAHLGVSVYPVRLPGHEAEAAPGRRHGVIVLSVLASSPAANAGLLIGDVLLELGGHALRGVEDLESVLGEAAIGTDSEILLVRAGSELRLPVRLEERPRAGS